MPASNAPDDDLLLVIACQSRHGGAAGETDRQCREGRSCSRRSARVATGSACAAAGSVGSVRVGATRSRARSCADRTPTVDRPQLETVTIVTKAGRTWGKKNEDVFSIQIMDTRERIQGYVKSDVQVVYDKDSLMPAYDSKRLSDTELSDLVGYLTTLRGYDVAVR
jgi:hypothetical protein